MSVPNLATPFRMSVEAARHSDRGYSGICRQMPQGSVSFAASVIGRLTKGIGFSTNKSFTAVALPPVINVTLPAAMRISPRSASRRFSARECRRIEGQRHLHRIGKLDARRLGEWRGMRDRRRVPWVSIRSLGTECGALGRQSGCHVGMCRTPQEDERPKEESPCPSRQQFPGSVPNFHGSGS